MRFIYGRTERDDQEQKALHAHASDSRSTVGRKLTFKQAFWHLCREGRGLSEEDTEKAWAAHVEADPQLKAYLERQQRAREQARLMAEQRQQALAQRRKDNP